MKDEGRSDFLHLTFLCSCPSPVPPSMYDTIIIGAGMSGLAAGIRLAHFQQRVCILERHSAIGGLNSFYRRGGRNFDVGLHALTNYAPRGTRQARWPGCCGSCGWPGTSSSLVAAARLGDRLSRRDAGFLQRLRPAGVGGRPAFPRPSRTTSAAWWPRWPDYDQFGPARRPRRSAREVVGGLIRDPLLVEMLFCPLLFYGGAREHDMDFGQFCILFRSIFLEGLARPLAGVRLILKRLVRKFSDLGGELRLRAGSSGSWSRTAGPRRRARRRQRTGAAQRPLLGRLAGDHAAVRRRRRRRRGRPADCRSSSRSRCWTGSRARWASTARWSSSTIREKFHYEKPAEAGRPPQRRRLLAQQLRSTTSRWPTACCGSRRWPTTTAGPALDAAAYRRQKRRWYERMVGLGGPLRPRFPRRRGRDRHVHAVTIRRFTGHEKGAIFGAAEKRYDGTTHLRNLFLCGNDQGLVGIIGTILSGISIANRYLLQDVRMRRRGDKCKR